MNTIAISFVGGAMMFFAVYLSFDYWYDRIWMRMLSVRDETLAVYKDLFIQKTAEQVLREQVILSSVVSGFFFFVMWPELMISIPVSLAAFYFSFRLPRFYLVNIVRPGRVRKFSVQMVDALTLMANGLNSGLNIPQTLQIVVDEMPNPIKQEFGFVLSENRLGKSLTEAFENLGKRVDSEDVSMFVTSVNILMETGGRLGETFNNIAKTIRERLKLQNKITAMTAQGMTSAVIVGALPWGLGVMLYMVDPVTMRPLFTHPAGWAILAVILMLEAAGFFVILKMVKIRV